MAMGSQIRGRASEEEKEIYRAAFKLTNIDDCNGYELINDLDFNDTDPLTAGNQFSKWAKGCSGSSCTTGTQADGTTGNTGWEPIQYHYFNDQGTATISDDIEFKDFFRSTFQGNGHTISGLYINRRDSKVGYAGLFGRLSGSCRLREHHFN